MKSLRWSVFAVFGVRDGAEMSDRLHRLIEVFGLAPDVGAANARYVDRSRWAAGFDAKRLANIPDVPSEGDRRETTEAA